MNFEEACRILGVPTTADTEEIHAQYIYKAQLLHPDKTTNLPEKVRHKAEEELKRINEAYSVLKNADTPRGDTPPKLSVSPAVVYFKDIAPGEKRTARIKVENIGGPFTRFWTDDEPAPWLKVLEAKSTTASPLPLEITLEATAPGTLEGKARCKLPILLENNEGNMRDQVDVTIELQPTHKNPVFPLKIFGPGLKNPFRKDKTSSPLAEKAWMPWLKTLLIVLAGYLTGQVLVNLSGINFALFLALGASIIYAIDNLHRGLTTRYKLLSYAYKLLLNLAVLGIAASGVWTGLQIYNTASLASASFIFLLIVEFITFVYALRVFSTNSWRRPKLWPTFFLLLAITIALSFAGVRPLAGYKDTAIDYLTSLFEQVKNWLEA